MTNVEEACGGGLASEWWQIKSNYTLLFNDQQTNTDRATE
jgi:hypothetical protein